MATSRRHSAAISRYNNHNLDLLTQSATIASPLKRTASARLAITSMSSREGVMVVTRPRSKSTEPLTSGLYQLIPKQVHCGEMPFCRRIKRPACFEYKMIRGTSSDKLTFLRSGWLVKPMPTSIPDCGKRLRHHPGLGIADGPAGKRSVAALVGRDWLCCGLPPETI
jgi:hypothetical protein